MKTIKLPCYEIVLIVKRNGGTITSDLHNEDVGTGPGEAAYKAAVDTLESFILAAAIAGIDVAAPAFIEAIETTVEAVSNHLD